MPIVTFGDMKAKPPAKHGKKAGITSLGRGERLSLSGGAEPAGNRKRIACKRVRCEVPMRVDGELY